MHVSNWAVPLTNYIILCAITGPKQMCTSSKDNLGHLMQKYVYTQAVEILKYKYFLEL